jgi:hypothetical protein
MILLIAKIFTEQIFVIPPLDNGSPRESEIRIDTCIFLHGASERTQKNAPDLYELQSSALYKSFYSYLMLLNVNSLFVSCP